MENIVSFLLYVILFIFGILGPFIIIFFFIFNFLGDFLGAPYVATSSKIVNRILKEAELKKKSKFIELGSGDGRITRLAVKNYKVCGVGVEVNLLLNWYSRLISKLQKIENIKFKRGDFFKINLKGADVIFIFLLPRSIKKLTPKFENELNAGTMVISHGFKIEGWNKKLKKTIKGKQFPTFYYRY